MLPRNLDLPIRVFLPTRSFRRSGQTRVHQLRRGKVDLPDGRVSDEHDAGRSLALGYRRWRGREEGRESGWGLWLGEETFLEEGRGGRRVYTA